MVEFRDRFCAEIGARLIVHTNRQALADGANPFRLGTQKCCGLLKTRALLDALTGAVSTRLSAERAAMRRNRAPRSASIPFAIPSANGIPRISARSCGTF